MGFLQNDFTNIYLDCVITDTGRQFLSRNDNSFSIFKFALGDDEIDYSIIEKFGIAVGKEKIEKSTPVFEALTNQNYAQKYKLTSVSNPNLVRLPSLILAGGEGNDTSKLINLGNVVTKRKTLVISQDIKNEDTIDVELRDQTFVVQLNNMFLQLVGQTPDFVDSQQRATYSPSKDSGATSKGGSRYTLTLEVKSISDTQFAIYGSARDKTLIKTYVRILGLQSGSTYEFEVDLRKGA